MKSGKLDRVLTVERLTVAVDDYGVVTEAWEAHGSLRGELVDDVTAENVRQHGASTEHTVTVRTWFTSDLTVADRLIYQDEPYNIIKIREIGRRRGLEITAERIGL